MYHLLYWDNELEEHRENPHCNLDMLKRDLLDIKQEPDEVATKFLKRKDPPIREGIPAQIW
uniref:Uncharacterized protein n=1 Tax=Romanomermis culicivorax TaxID=13658 RepID=A0A915KIW1_ROMCU